MGMVELDQKYFEAMIEKHGPVTIYPVEHGHIQINVYFKDGRVQYDIEHVKAGK